MASSGCAPYVAAGLLAGAFAGYAAWQAAAAVAPPSVNTIVVLAGPTVSAPHTPAAGPVATVVQDRKLTAIRSAPAAVPVAEDFGPFTARPRSAIGSAILERGLPAPLIASQDQAAYTEGLKAMDLDD
jgi:hypothetical protein